jgi:hypothetical protein
MITKECFGCEKVTSHEHLRDCAPGIPETHMVASERFVCVLFVTFAGSDGGLGSSSSPALLSCTGDFEIGSSNQARSDGRVARIKLLTELPEHNAPLSVDPSSDEWNRSTPAVRPKVARHSSRAAFGYDDRRCRDIQGSCGAGLLWAANVGAAGLRGLGMKMSQTSAIELRRRRLTKNQQSVQALAAHGADQAFR